MRRTYPPCSEGLIVGLLALTVHTAACAAGDEDVYFSDLPVVASVSRLPQALADAPTSVTVIDRDIIKASGARDLSDVFRLVPGFQTYPHTTEAPRVTYHGLGDGDYASRVQVMIDGRSLYSPLFGSGVNWATLPVALEDIERIEVVRGTNAVSYGSNAYLGVINIITVDPSLVRGVSVSTNYGNQNVRDYTVRGGGRLGEAGHVRFTYRSQNDDALRNRWDWVDSYGTQLLDLRADLALGDRDSLQLSAGQAEGRLQNGRVADRLNPLRSLEQTHAYVQATWRHVLSDTSDLQLRYAHVVDRSADPFSIRFPAIPALGLAPRTETISATGDEGSRDEIELQHTLRWSRSLRLVLGGNYRHDTMVSAWTLPGQGSVARDNGRLFGNAEWKPVAWFTGNFGLAGESDSMAGEHLSPRLSTSFHLDRQNTVRFGLSRAHRTGSTLDYRGDWWDIPPWAARYGLEPRYAFRAAPALPTERLDTVEIGYLGDWRERRASLDVRAFRERVHNRHFKIDQGYGNLGAGDPAANTAANLLIPSATLPIQDVHMYGVEYQFRWQPFDATRLMLSQNFTRIASDFLPDALASATSMLASAPERNDVERFTEQSAPSRTTSLLVMQKLPLGFELSAAGYWQEAMKWSRNTTAGKYHRLDMRLGYPFRIGAIGGEVALTVQALNGSHSEYKSDGKNPDGRIVDRRQWLSLRLDY